MEGHEPGKGTRQLSSFLAGLSPQQPFHNVADYPGCVALAAGKNTILEELWQHTASSAWSKGNIDAPEWRSIILVKRGLWFAGDTFPRTRVLFASLVGEGAGPMEVCIARMPPHT